MKKYLRLLFAFLIVIISATSTWQLASASPLSTCDYGNEFTLAEVDQLSGSKFCDVPMEIIFPDGQVQDIPDAGSGIAVSRIYADGVSESSVVVFHLSDGQLGAIAEGQPYGVSITTLANSVTPIQASLSSTPTKCSNSAYSLYPYRWTNTHNWYYRPTGEPATNAITAIRAGLNTWRSGVSLCTGNPYSSSFPSGYLGTTSTGLSNINSTGNCTTADAYSVVAWGTLPANTLALTCTSYTISGSAVYSDAKYNTQYSWFTSSATTGCLGSQIDLQSIATHEFGHTLGFDHAPQASDQVMRTSSPSCDLTQRNLGKGDLLVLSLIYP
jgi:hypothetical protein